MNDAVIRPATLQDIDNIDQLLRSLAESMDDLESYRGNIEALKHHGFGEKPIYRAVIAEQDEQAIGLCVFFPEFSTWRCEAGVYVQDLYVDKELRGAGLGGRLLEATMTIARESWQAEYLRLAVHVLNHDAQGFYKALGFSADEDNQVMVLSGKPIQRLMNH